MTVPTPDGVYYVTFGAGALLGPGALILRRGKIGGMGHDAGHFAGSYHYDPAAKLLNLDIAIRVPAATPIAVGVKAGPAGSAVHVQLVGPQPQPSHTFRANLAGHTGELTLQLFAPLCVASDPAAPASVVSDPPHPDAFPDGIYKVESAGAAYLSRTVIALMDGQLVGVGMLGARYIGTYVFDSIRKLTSCSGHGEVPPHVPLVTGGFAGPQGLVIPITSETKFNGGRSRFSFSMIGRAVDAELIYQGPLPG